MSKGSASSARTSGPTWSIRRLARIPWSCLVWSCLSCRSSPTPAVHRETISTVSIARSGRLIRSGSARAWPPRVEPVSGLSKQRLPCPIDSFGMPSARCALHCDGYVSPQRNTRLYLRLEINRSLFDDRAIKREGIDSKAKAGFSSLTEQ